MDFLFVVLTLLFVHSYAVVGVILAKPNFAHEWCVFPLTSKECVRCSWVYSKIFSIYQIIFWVCVYFHQNLKDWSEELVDVGGCNEVSAICSQKPLQIWRSVFKWTIENGHYHDKVAD